MRLINRRRNRRRGWLAFFVSTAVVLAVVATAVWTRAADDDDGGAGGSASFTTGPTDAKRATPSPYLPERELVSVGKGLRAYNPHRPSQHRWTGSGHTHAEDHSGMAAGDQERRFEAVGHDFIWLTSHDGVVADPGVDGIVHMFGVEVFGESRGEQPGPHWLALLPDGRLTGTDGNPFGRYEWSPSEMAEKIAEVGGLPVLAHPSRYSLPKADLAAVDARLWGIEGTTSRTSSDKDMPWVDARLSAGKYTCISAGADTHEDDWSLTRGYQLVGTDRAPPTREELFAQVRACNFFACTVKGPDDRPIEEPELTILEGEIVLSVARPVDRVEFVGKNGRTLHRASDTDVARYSPSADDLYVRARAHRTAGNAECLSQPVWLF